MMMKCVSEENKTKAFETQVLTWVQCVKSIKNKLFIYSLVTLQICSIAVIVDCYFTKVINSKILILIITVIQYFFSAINTFFSDREKSYTILTCFLFPKLNNENL